MAQSAGRYQGNDLRIPINVPFLETSFQRAKSREQRGHFVASRRLSFELSAESSVESSSPKSGTACKSLSLPDA